MRKMQKSGGNLTHFSSGNFLEKNRGCLQVRNLLFKQQAWERYVELGLYKQNSSCTVGVVGQESMYVDLLQPLPSVDGDVTHPVETHTKKKEE